MKIKSRPVNKRVLEYVNRIRVAHGADPITKLPRGFKSSAMCMKGKECNTMGCVLANALVAAAPTGGGVAVDGEEITFYANRKTSYGITNLTNPIEYIKVPKYISKFIELFDNGYYPQLIDPKDIDDD